MWNTQLSPEVSKILARFEEAQERAAWEQARAAQQREQREQQLRQLDRRAPVRQAGDHLITKTTKGEAITLTLEEFRQYRPDVPPPPPLAAKPKVTKRSAETLRQWVWAQPSDRSVSNDWIETRCSYPSDPQGSCRHKVSYLCGHLGGRAIFGTRTDQRGASQHAVLEIAIAGERLILDRDQTWKASEAPFEPNPIPWLPRHLHPGYQPQRKAQPSPRPHTDLQALQDQLAELERRVGDGFRYREVWQEGVEYKAGDAVTRSGHMWVALAPTTEQPGAGATSWRMAVKGGRNGKDSQGYIAQKRPNRAEASQDEVSQDEDGDEA